VAFYIVSGPAQISGNRVTLTGPGTVTIRAYTNSERPFFPIATAERTFQVIPILSVAPNLADEVQIFPNPVQDELKIKVSKQLEAGPMELSDINGRLVLPKTSVSSSQETILDLKNVQTGIYLLSIPTNKGVIRQKIVKQ